MIRIIKNSQYSNNILKAVDDFAMGFLKLIRITIIEIISVIKRYGIVTFLDNPSISDDTGKNMTVTI